ncbi:hypothetical protein [Cytobacillus praedii]|uniref:Uncharacterized protein n=1 Tax=Cytobacillus praedii TaxID=1742358 RepID=A0A4R1AWS0_9BACI|nr:hypothetical protein [Cytobacillus praedii]TCJ04882.1 hypothetical protein E0Y62_06580 [Cytobacillus praedii]
MEGTTELKPATAVKNDQKSLVEITTDHIDKVVSYKGRVWTIYGTTNNGVFAFNGVKPYPEFKFRSQDDFWRSRFKTTFIPAEDVKTLEEIEIAEYVKQEKAADKKKLKKKYATEFFSWLTGHTKGFVSKHLEERFNGYQFAPGHICYEIWKSEGALLLSHNTNFGYTQHSYFDYVTWESDDRLYEKRKREHEDEIIENYRDYIIEEYKKSTESTRW